MWILDADSELLAPLLLGLSQSCRKRSCGKSGFCRIELSEKKSQNSEFPRAPPFIQDLRLRSLPSDSKLNSSTGATPVALANSNP